MEVMDRDLYLNDIRHFNRYYTNKLGLLARYRFNTQLTLTEARVLFEIGRRGLHTHGMLSAELKIDGGYLNRVIAKLGDLELIKKRKDDSDGRIVLLELTKKGLSRVRHIDEASDDDAGSLVDALGDSERAELVSHMRAIEKILEGFGHHAPSIIPALTVQDIAAVRVLVREYVASLGVNLAFQGIEKEIASLPGGYAAPTGALFLARMTSRADALADTGASGPTGEPAGCVALHRLDDETCEMKRLFVRPEYRGYGIGQSLANRILAEARSLGYKRMRLDTLDRLEDAVRLYRKLGFAEIPAYYENPLDGVLFFEKRL